MKTLSSCVLRVCLATLSAISTRAQVFSDNTAGYVTVPYLAGWNLIANPLDFYPGGNNVTNVFANNLPNQSTLVTYSGGSPSSYTYLTGLGWFDSHLTLANSLILNPGQGAALFLNTGPTNITMFGNVLGYDFEHNARLPVTPPPAGVYLLSSIAPTGNNSFADIIGRAPHNNDSVMFLDTGGTFSIYTFQSGLWLDPQGGHSAPTVGIAHSAFFDLTGNEFSGFDFASITAVPEPATLWLLGLGATALFAFRRRNAD